MKKFIELTKQILNDERQSKKDDVFTLIEFINNYNHNTLEEVFSDILVELSQDLECYVENLEWRREDPIYYGDDKLEIIIKEALRKIDELMQEKPK